MRLLIADDHPVFRDGLRILLDLLPEIEIVGEATNGKEVVIKASECGPDVILMDIGLPGINGIEATRQILRSNPGISILIVTMYEDDDSIFAAMRAGARGYVLKGADQDDILLAVRAVSSGGVIFSPTIAHRALAFFATFTRTRAQVFPELTEREREVLELIARGDNNTIIAEQLIISPKTVRNLVSSIFSKLQVASRAEAIVRAREAGLGQQELD
ncbi:response regulator transcription factor [Ktedonosporobacter rubrisoli]|uniref:Response regulator transcription factor n=1 Tax=Ktedonosporobacter rubrisoli TaxID=2509675 RepID=A0A4P6K5S1_KTERU|nr:response regulator transcription factor [Ktedonosporobacter rubrisoli]